jgi:outer membrane protein assembly factor BamB
MNGDSISRRALLRGLCGAAVGVTAAGLVTAQQPDSWTTAGYDAANTSANLASEPVQTSVRPQWEFDPKESAVSSPVVIGEQVYLHGRSDQAYVVDSDVGGSQVYSLRSGGTPNSIADVPEPVQSRVSSPTIQDGVLYVNERGGTVYAIDIQTGDQLWSFSGDSQFRSSPTVVDGTLYAVSVGGSVHAIDIVSGDERWQYTIDGPLLTMPAVNRGTVYVSSGTGEVVALDTESGSEQWSYDAGAAVYTAPTVSAGRVWIGTVNGVVTTINDDGSEDWTRAVGGSVIGSPALVNTILVVGTREGTIIGFDQQSGTQQWRASISGQISGSPCATTDLVYLGSTSSTIAAYDVSDGEQRWRHTVGSAVATSPIVAGGQVLFGTTDGRVLSLGEASGTAAMIANAQRLTKQGVEQYGRELLGVGAGGAAVVGGYVGVRKLQNRRGGDGSTADTTSTSHSPLTGVDAAPIVTDSRPESEENLPDLSDASFEEFDQRGLIGRGGNADVHRATILVDGVEHTVALKIPRMADYETVDTSFFDEFVSEAEVWDSIDDHPNVVTVLGWGRQPHPWIALEYMDGGDLSESLPELDRADVFAHLEEACEAVHHTHRQGITHTDLKPENVLFTDVGDTQVAKVADWGLATVLLEHSMSVQGLTPAYSAPEQIDPERFGGTDDRTDIYQLGVVAYEAFTGRPPFNHDSSSAMINAVLNESPTPPTEIDSTLPEALDDVLLSAIAKRKTERYETVLHFRDDLRRVWNLLKKR